MVFRTWFAAMAFSIMALGGLANADDKLKGIGDLSGTGLNSNSGGQGTIGTKASGDGGAAGSQDLKGTGGGLNSNGLGTGLDGNNPGNSGSDIGGKLNGAGDLSGTSLNSNGGGQGTIGTKGSGDGGAASGQDLKGTGSGLNSNDSGTSINDALSGNNPGSSGGDIDGKLNGAGDLSGNSLNSNGGSQGTIGTKGSGDGGVPSGQDLKGTGSGLNSNDSGTGINDALGGNNPGGSGGDIGGKLDGAGDLSGGGLNSNGGGQGLNSVGNNGSGITGGDIGNKLDGLNGQAGAGQGGSGGSQGGQDSSAHQNQNEADNYDENASEDDRLAEALKNTQNEDEGAERLTHDADDKVAPPGNLEDALKLYQQMAELYQEFQDYQATSKQDKAQEPQLDANGGPGLPVHCKSMDQKTLEAQYAAKKAAIAAGKTPPPEDPNAGQCVPCYTEAEKKINVRRVAFERLRILLNYTQKMAIQGENALSGFGAAGGGLATMEAQAQIRKVDASLADFYAAYDDKYVHVLAKLKDSLDDFAKCETTYFNNPDWYNRYGFVYYQFMADKYKRN